MRISYATESGHEPEMANGMREAFKKHFDRWVFLYFWAAYLVLSVLILIVAISIF